mgnify:CR=1 FL=1
MRLANIASQRAKYNAEIVESMSWYYCEVNCFGKGTNLFWIEQIKKPFMRIFHKWQGYNAILNMSGNGMRCGLDMNYK